MEYKAKLKTEVDKSKSNLLTNTAKLLVGAGAGKMLLTEVSEETLLKSVAENIDKLRMVSERTLDRIASDMSRIRQLQERQIDLGQVEHMNLTIVNRWDKHHFTQSYKSIYIRNKGPAVVTLKIELNMMTDAASEKFIATNSPEIEIDTTDIIDIKFNEERITGLQCRTPSSTAVLKVTLAR